MMLDYLNCISLRQESSAGGLVTIAIAMNIAVFMVLGTALYQSATLLSDSQERYLRLVKLRGDIAHYDEVLTMSARMTAASGDLDWEQRYHQFEPLLDTTIAEAEQLAPPVAGQAASMTDAANQALVAMELEAFSLVRAGRPAEATQLLDSAEYTRQKEIYSAGLDSYIEGVLAEVSSAMTTQQDRNRAARIGALVGAVTLLGVWVLVIRRVSSWQIQMKDAENAAQVRRLAEDLLQAEDVERERLAMVLHDDLQQLLVSAHLRLDAAPAVNEVVREDVKAARSAVRRAIEVSRSLSSDLTTGNLTDGDFGTVLRAIAQETYTSHGLRTDVDVSAVVHADETSRAVTRFLLRTARELLFNVVKHAGADRAWMSLHQEHTELVLSIRDNGKGFRIANEGDESATGLGLPAIRQRTFWLGGQLSIASANPPGTTVTLRLPMREPAQSRRTSSARSSTA